MPACRPGRRPPFSFPMGVTLVPRAGPASPQINLRRWRNRKDIVLRIFLNFCGASRQQKSARAPAQPSQQGYTCYEARTLERCDGRMHDGAAIRTRQRLERQECALVKVCPAPDDGRGARQWRRHMRSISSSQRQRQRQGSTKHQPQPQPRQQRSRHSQSATCFLVLSALLMGNQTSLLNKVHDDANRHLTKHDEMEATHHHLLHNLENRRRRRKLSDFGSFELILGGSWHHGTLLPVIYCQQLITVSLCTFQILKMRATQFHECRAHFKSFCNNRTQTHAP